MKYYIQFPAGTRSLVISAMESLVPDAVTGYKDDSSLIFETRVQFANAAKLPFATNVFQVLATSRRTAIPRTIRHINARLDTVDFPSANRREQGFRVMVNIDGELVAIDRDLRGELEVEIAHRTGTHVQSRGSCREYWILGRRQLEALLFCLRLPKDRAKQVAKGALSPELSTLLVLASRPDEQDAFLDPFAGSGAIVEARLRYPYRSIISSDIKRQTLSTSLLRKAKTDRRVKLRNEDALELVGVRDGEVDVIVSDPPWGEFDRLTMPFPAFAHVLAASFDRVLNPETGRVVLLIGRKQADTLVGALKGANFRIHATHQILVNGHPASVIVGSR